jgi:hypothetical protein
MNPLHDSDLARQQARAWSEQLGRLAAEMPANRPEAAFTQLDNAPPPARPTRLLSMLGHLLQRQQRRQHAADKLRAQEFIMGP